MVKKDAGIGLACVVVPALVPAATTEILAEGVPDRPLDTATVTSSTFWAGETVTVVMANGNPGDCIGGEIDD